jgi:hypothetical protein
MRKIIFFGIGLILICAAGWGIYKVTKPHQNVEGEQAVATLTAENLYHQFVSTENIANKKWIGKVIEITGIISSVNETGNYISVNLAASPEGGINCSVLKSEMEMPDMLKKGNPIVIKGKCTGFLMDVNMVDCVIKK